VLAIDSPALTGAAQTVKTILHVTWVVERGNLFGRHGAEDRCSHPRLGQPDFDIESLEVVPSLTLSRPEELLLRLPWVAILYGWVRANLAITGGVHSAEDVLKSMMAGAHVAMMTSALLQNGIDHVAPVLKDLVRWMEDHEYESIRQMRGSMSQRSVSDSAAFERGNYMPILTSYGARRQVGNVWA
jgi:dihydroorotate dehydrogenase (fumarate)